MVVSASVVCPADFVAVRGAVGPAFCPASPENTVPHASGPRKDQNLKCGFY